MSEWFSRKSFSNWLKQATQLLYWKHRQDIYLEKKKLNLLVRTVTIILRTTSHQSFLNVLGLLNFGQVDFCYTFCQLTEEVI